MKFSIRAEFLLVFTLPKASRANTSELINAKTINMAILIILTPRAIVKGKILNYYTVTMGSS